MFIRFPQCLFKPGPVPMAGGLLLSSITVHNDAELADAIAAGWFESPEAADASRAKPQPPADADDKRPPTRAELEQKAVELGIPFSPRTSDKKLAAEIAERLAA